MQGVFLRIVSMGINASWMIVAVLLLRVLFWKFPKWIACFLWILVGIRLICPFDLESAMSLVPVRMEAPLADSGGKIVKKEKDIAKNDFQPENTGGVEKDFMADSETILTVSTGERIVLDSTVIGVFTIIWLCGMFAMFFYFLMSYLYIHKKTETATHLMENVWESEFAASPFVFGLVHPQIYIPYSTKQEHLVYILAHEYAHLKRKDHLLKIAAFFILSVYWFHPLVWSAYVFLGRDIEFACDEKAVLAMDKQEKKNYMLALLNSSTAERNASIYPLAFGKIGVKERVIRIKQWKKPSFVMLAATLLVCIIVSICFFSVPDTKGIKGKAERTVTNADSGILEIKQASVNLSENTGADGTALYYVDAEKIIFGGYFGLFVYDKVSGSIVQSLDLEYIGCNQTQGSNYCEIAADKAGQRIYLNPVAQKKLYVFDLLSNTLVVKEYPKSDIWKDRSLALFRIENTKQVSYRDGKEERICKLKEGDFTIGDCTYAEYNRKDLESGKPVSGRAFFGFREDIRSESEGGRTVKG